MFKFEESFFVEKQVNVSASRAWHIISKPGGLTCWHPFMEKNETQNWQGVGSKDHLYYYSGFEFEREVVEWIDGIGFDLKVSENGKRENTASWRLIPVDDNNCILRITGRVDFLKRLPLIIRWAILKFKLRPVYMQYLSQILEGFAFHAETCQSVVRDQFGSHPIFSK